MTSSLRFILALVLAVPSGLALVTNALAQAETQYSELFESLQPGLYTVEVVDRISNNKNAQGSGFIVTEDGVLATNYHVVSEFVQDPDRYSLRYRDADGQTGPLEVLEVDVLHDLALVRFADDAESPGQVRVFELAET